ncbi:probable sucrose-phosphate synthase 1 isoform X1 [Rhododendron vialii]|uniref:probable sucrose-phosphate synthase 1 isoform X1 n=2 Tax=Rhododendron vialii TaxID=182163 RepID=UPI00265E2853|nr:probable sucrose-phosphate synthase 1 isoform X1 [Rhododendron vialii]
MAGNDWINSYLEAILDVGPGIDDAKSSLLLRERGRFSPTRYFVEQVIGFDETDLYRSWVKAAATRSPQERNTRLENMCWRIWNLARQKKQLEEKEAQRMAKRRVERERGRREATADMSEDFSEGEKGDTVSDLSAHGESHRSRLPRISSVETMEAWVSQQKGKKLYIVLVSLHGLIRGENMELGRDSDTGGQVKYVVELARALGSMPGVYRVDLLTRQVSAPDVDWSYGEPTEMLPPRNSDGLMDEMGESSGAYIVRIPFGPRNKYLPKESLWPYIPEFVDGALNHILQMSKVLGEQVGGGHPVWPVAIHGHYADAGDAAALLSGSLNVPMLFTGHSLGRDKLEQLLRQGRLSKEEINTTYKIMRRIEAEELALDASEIVITSTRQEIEEQWRLYDGFDPVLERKLRARIRRNVSCYGRFMPRMVVITPGMEFQHIVPHDGDMDGETEGNEDQPTSQDPLIWTEIMRFFTNPRKPMILALARPDPKKNLTTLVKAFGECRPLRELANLTLIMGNRDDVDEMSSTSASVLLSILKLIDKYDLYGQVAYPKHHKQSDVPDIYRLAAKTKGVFINPAFIEPFGLTLIEAAAYGLPIVATKNGGPVDILRVLDNGLLIDPHDEKSIADALLKLVADKQLWAKCRQNGLKNIHLFSWPEHCKTYLSRIAGCKPRQPWWQRSDDGDENSESDSPSDSLRDIQDISLNLRFSMDGEKNSGSGNADSPLESDDRKTKLENAVFTWSKGVLKGSQKAGLSEKADHNSSAGKFPALRRRQHMIVIAVDFDDITDIFSSARKIFDAVEKERSEGSIGFILATSFTLAEIHSFLISGGLSPTDFDAFICNSGSDLYYSSPNSEDNPFVVDLYYHSHIEYRWGGEGLRKTLVRWAGSIIDKKGENEEQVVTEDEKISTNYCYSFKVRNPGKVPPVKEVRKYMRIQALRCHVIYCQNGSKINVIPVLASRSQALRYLYLRWGVNLSKMVVFVGESGDTDYEGLLGGLHKSVVLKGVCTGAINQLHANRNYPLSDVLPSDSPNIVQATEECSSDDIRNSLEKLGFVKG